MLFILGSLESPFSGLPISQLLGVMALALQANIDKKFAFLKGMGQSAFPITKFLKSHCVYQAYKSTVSFKYKATQNTWCVLKRLIWMTGPGGGRSSPRLPVGYMPV